MRNRRQHGFTLLELLVVMTIVGILIAIVISSSLTTQRRSQLRDAAVQLIADLNQARGLSSRTSVDTAVALCVSGSACTATSGPTTTYQNAWTGAGSGIRILPNGIKVAVYSSSANKITYAAPNGEVSTNGILWQLSSPTISDVYYVKAVGVTGKVIFSATPN